MSVELLPQDAIEKIHDSVSVSFTQPKVNENDKSNKYEPVEAVRRPFSPKSEKYIRKLDRLVKIYGRISEVCIQPSKTIYILINIYCLEK